MTQETRLWRAGCVFRALSPVTFVVLSSLQGGHEVDYCFFAPFFQLCSASPGEAQHLLQSPSSVSLSSVKTYDVKIKKKRKKKSMYHYACCNVIMQPVNQTQKDDKVHRHYQVSSR